MELSPAKEESANNPFACNICPTKHRPKNKPLLLIECCRGQVIFVRAISLESLSHLFRLPSLLLSHTLQSPFDNSYNDRARFSSLLCRHTVLSNTTMASAADSSKRRPMTDTQCWSEFARLFANYLLRVIEKCVCVCDFPRSKTFGKRRRRRRHHLRVVSDERLELATDFDDKCGT